MINMNSDALVVATTLGLYTAVVVSPGPNFALISRLAISGARPAAIGATFGLAVAAMFYAILTMTGLALVLTRVGGLARSVQLAGGCYLIYLGLSAWLASKPARVETQPASARSTGLQGFRMGIIVNLSNPKGIAFFIGLYSIAIPPHTALWAKLLILIGGFLIEIIWYGLVTCLLSTQPARAAYNRFGLWIERAIGAVLAGFGLRLLSAKL
jgi:threonine/homoserine/homoserine lactone efflux protein